MSAAVIMERFAEASPHSKARAAGVFYLLTIVTGVTALILRDRLIVTGDAAATASNILANESLFRLSFASDLICFVCYIAVTLLLYDLFKAVNRSLSLLAAFFSLVGCVIGTLSGIFHLAPLALLGGAKYLSVFTVEQLQALALTSLRLRGQTYMISIVFFAFYCLLIGYLIFRSTFLPRILGVLMAIGGAAWLIDSFASFLSPESAKHLWPYIGAPGLIGEGSLTLWLLVMGVNVQRWRDQANVLAQWRSPQAITLESIAR